MVDLEYLAFRALEQADHLVRQIQKDAAHSDDPRLAEWITADDKAERLVNLSAEVHRWYGHLCDALELVDWRSGEIRDREINEWLLNEVIGGLCQLDHPRYTSWSSIWRGNKRRC